MSGFALVVDEDHVVAFAPPAVGVLQHAQRHAHQVAAAARLQVDVVQPAIEIELGALADSPARTAPLCRYCAWK